MQDDGTYQYCEIRTKRGLGGEIIDEWKSIEVLNSHGAEKLRTQLYILCNSNADETMVQTFLLAIGMDTTEKEE